MRSGVVLINSSMIGQSAISSVQQWVGGRTSLVINALAYGGTLSLQFQNGSNWVPIGSSFVSDQVFTFDAPPGDYRLVTTTASSTIGVNAGLYPVPYNL